MSTATLAQGNQIAELILQQRKTEQGLQEIIESGLFTDVLKSNPKQVDRDKVKAALGLFPKLEYVLDKRWWLVVDRKTPFSRVLSRLGAETKQPDKSPMPDNIASVKEAYTSSGREYRIASFKNYECPAWKNHIDDYNFTEFDLKRAVAGYGWTHGDVRALITIANHPHCPRDGKIVALGTERTAWNGDVGWTIFPSLEWRNGKWIFNPRDSGFIHEYCRGYDQKKLYFLVCH